MTVAQKSSYEVDRILIGSQALNRYMSSDSLNRQQDIVTHSDSDYWIKDDSAKPISANPSEQHLIDCHIVPEHIFDYIVRKGRDDYHDVLSSSQSLITMEPDISSTFVMYANFEMLYTIKCSHAQFDVQWEKTMNDIKCMQKHNLNVELDEDLYEMLYDFWLKVHRNNKDKVDLDKSNEAFFDDSVQRLWDHDSLHEAMAFTDRPMYEKFKYDQSSAMLSEKLFAEAETIERIQLCLEEIYVTALERFMIPRNFKMGRNTAMKQATKQLVTSMTKGWFPKYIIENWSRILHAHDQYQSKGMCYVKRYEAAVENKELKYHGYL